MANTRLIKRRIKSAQNISQITKAMEMVAASKMKKAQDAAVLGKPYAEKIAFVTRELADKIDKKLHPLLSSGNSYGKTLIILISTNKGLCGGLNTNLFRMVYNWVGHSKEVDFITLGTKGQNFVLRTGNNLVADFSQNYPFVQNIPALTKLFVDAFTKGIYKEVYLAFNSFINALKQVPSKKLILPIVNLSKSDNKEKNYYFSEFLIEPSINEVIDSLLPHYLENQVRAAIYEAEASDAAKDLTDELTLIYNKARQEKITNEIADIVTARTAVE